MPAFLKPDSKTSGTRFKKLIANKKAPLNASISLSTFGFSVLNKNIAEPLIIIVINNIK